VTTNPTQILESDAEQAFSFTMIDSVWSIVMHTVLHHQLEVGLAATTFNHQPPLTQHRNALRHEQWLRISYI